MYEDIKEKLENDVITIKYQKETWCHTKKPTA